MSWTRSLLAALAVCVLLLTGSAGCGSSDARDQGESGASPSPVGKVLDDTDDDGRHYREVDEGGAPEVGIEVQPDPVSGDGSWDVRLTVRGFRFSPAGTKAQAVAGRGLAYLFVDGRLVTRLRTPEYRLAADLVPRGTHKVTVRLYADDGTVWAVNGDPVESAADITASEAEATVTPTPTPTPSTAALSAPGTRLRTGGRGSPDRGGKAS
ncbi:MULTISPECIES: hypothetical protein [unclassified Streptomyces]|uniref:hypothetical protein n=1 Tax=unclassified Streptomyces TaxID=2593676 RepID=UPI0023671C88|nr:MULTISPECIES: hypothetical protein [unclassified Streptomyces]MDF3144558.1 hypothetical protein [Streptomyces sp. T21Q-yed]WDF36958.1 hypothetical protein PBV52_09295 [Streptomyces sp. T12]